jgi:DNA-binding Xre family transcriptional regulator
VKRVHSKFRELLAAKAQRENRPISVRKACAEAGITWRIGYGMADDTISAFPRDDLSKLCAYLDCDLSELLVLEETTPRSTSGESEG